VIVAGLLALASGMQGQAPAFEDITKSALPNVQVVCGALDKRWIPEVNGGGLGLEDLNGDGVLDLLVVDGSEMQSLREGKPEHPPRLFLGQGDGSFKPAPEEWKMAPCLWGTGLALGDVNGDGWCDAVIASMGGLQLYQNNAGQGWTLIGASGLQNESGWFTSLAFLDANADGKLDLFAVRYLAFDPKTAPGFGEQGARWKGSLVMFGPEGFTPQADCFFLGQGDGTFTAVPLPGSDFGEPSKDIDGIQGPPPGFGLGVICSDIDSDGDTDVYVSNDSTPNHLWRNSGDGTFEEAGFAMGVSHGSEGREQAGMGIACATLGTQAAPSLFVTNFSGESNAFYQPSRKGRYRERSARVGIASPSRSLLGWGTGFFDWDLDGRQDLWVLNGHVYPQADNPGSDTSYAQVDQLFVQGADGRFTEGPLHTGPARVSRTGVSGDIDGDGDEDLVLWTIESGLQVLRNNTKADARWVGIRLRGKGPNTDAIGAQMHLKVGDLVQRAEITRSAGFQASRPAQRIFGLGQAKAGVSIFSVLVKWPQPHAHIEVYKVEPGKVHTLTQP